MASAKPFAAALESFLVLLLVFALHRWLSYSSLYGAIEPGTSEAAKAFVVGLLSDFWVAYLWAVVIGIGYALLLVGGFAGTARLFWLAVLTLVAICASAQVSYIEFFHFQMIPFHLRYLLDPEFIAANGSSLFSTRALLNFSGFIVATLAVLRLDALRSARFSRLAVAVAVLSVGALFVHNRNLRFKVQWFVPENLQVNGFERLYLHFKNSHLPEPLAEDELARLATDLGDPAPDPSGVNSDTLFQVLSKPVAAAGEVTPLGAALRQAFHAAVERGEKPVVIVVLMESLRPSETGYFSNGGGAGLTPMLDGLAARGLAFRRAFSTGSVTRGAQEASLCGYHGARDTSLMRGQAINRLVCLGDRLRDGRTAAGKRGTTFWYHGGDGRFDGQLEFWKRHGINDFLSLVDFASTEARTGWGIGDATFMTTAAEKLEALDRESPTDFLLGIALSVTNHIPWDLPSDASEELQKRAFAHPSYRTTAYLDEAISRFVALLQKDGLWKKSVVIFASDHGNSLAPAQDLYGPAPDRDLWLQSHINFIISGGLAETVVAAQPMDKTSLDLWTSQADIAPLIAGLVGIEGVRFMGEDPFATNRRLPVFADLETSLFPPALGHGLDRSATTRQAIEKTPPAERSTLLYYRALLQFINSWSR